MLRTGWSEAELGATSPATVASMRHGLYAEALQPVVAIDVDHQLQEVADARVDNPKSQQTLRRRRLGEAEMRLRAFRKIQDAVREALYLDDPEPIPTDAET